MPVGRSHWVEKIEEPHGVLFYWKMRSNKLLLLVRKVVLINA